MDFESHNQSLSGAAAAPALDRDSDRRALDELFRLTLKYSSTKSYDELLKFIAHFRSYSPFNAMLVHVQMRDARYIAPPRRWLSDYRRRIKPGARTLVLLQPRGPVMFAYDVSDTEPLEGAPSLPREVTDPFAIRSGRVGNELQRTVENAMRDGVRVSLQKSGSQGAGSIRRSGSDASQAFPIRLVPKAEYVQIPVRYELLLNSDHNQEVQYATLVHELAHLFCGHLGTPNPTWWHDRRGLPIEVLEFEAESVSYLVCKRVGIDNPSEQYLSQYMVDHAEVPEISLDAVMTASGLIERMARERLKPRKDGKQGKGE